MEWLSRITTTARAITPRITAWERKRFTGSRPHLWSSGNRVYEGPRCRPSRGKRGACRGRCYERLQSNTAQGRFGTGSRFGQVTLTLTVLVSLSGFVLPVVALTVEVSDGLDPLAAVTCTTMVTLAVDAGAI
jgi:hypothetical protein